MSAVTLKQAAVDTFHETLAQTLLIFICFFVVFACTLAFGVTYNAARIALSERGRELATLRVLGFTRGGDLLHPAGRDRLADLHRAAAGLRCWATASRALIAQRLQDRAVPDPDGDPARDLRPGRARSAWRRRCFPRSCVRRRLDTPGPDRRAEDPGVTRKRRRPTWHFPHRPAACCSGCPCRSSAALALALAVPAAGRAGGPGR